MVTKENDRTRICIICGRDQYQKLSIIPISNECQVKFNGRIYDVLNSEDKVPKKCDEHQGMDITGNMLVFRVVR